MDPITGTLALIGIGTALFGGGGSTLFGMKAADVASQVAGVSQNILGLQEQENTQRQLAMQISARRQQVEITRQTQLRMAMGQASATNQGGLQSSGYAGGQAQVRGEGEFSMEGVNQNLTIGNTLFGLQGQISQQQSLMAQLQGQQASYQGQGAMFSGISSIGSSLAGSAGPLGNILGNFFQGGPSANNDIYSNPELRAQLPGFGPT